MTAREILETEIENWSRLGHVPVLQMFVLRNGVECRPTPYAGRRGRPKECFANASRMSVGAYCEGFALSPLMPLLIHHAWRATDDGEVIDPTWDAPESRLYYGVRFEEHVLRREELRSGCYGILDTGHGLNVGLMLEMDPGMRDVMNRARVRA